MSEDKIRFESVAEIKERGFVEDGLRNKIKDLEAAKKSLIKENLQLKRAIKALHKTRG